MSRKKGLSLEEKRTRLLEFFYEKKEPFLLKDLEKLVPKAKGLPMQTVKDVLTSLVGDDMVDTDKIGTSVYFWAFPSKSLNNKLNKVKNLENALSELNEKDAAMGKEIANSIENCSESAENAKRRIEMEEELTSLKKQRTALQEKVDRLNDCDPDQLNQMKNECKTAREAVERWTDNVFAVKSWCKKNFQIEESEFSNSLNIPADFDYFEG